jgi:folate-binding protein YgfZ
MALLLDEPAVAERDAGVVRVTGPDRLTYLHSLLSQHFEGATPGMAADFLYLDAKGNAKAAGRALVGQDDVLLVTPPEVASELAAALNTYRFLLQVEAEDVSGRFALASIRGPSPIRLQECPAEPMTAAVDRAGFLVRDRSGGVDLLGPPEWLRERVAETQLPAASSADWERWRIAAGEPGWGSEIVPGRRAQELGLLPSHVHLRKGCYPGQESIAKIYNLGRPRRALAVVEFDGPVAAGEALAAGGRRGEVTSSAEAGAVWLALALVPLDTGGQVPDEEITAGAVRGRVRRRVGEGLPQPGASASRVQA